MSSLWTPDGERRVPPADEPAPAASTSPTGPPPTGSAPDSSDPLRAAAEALGVDLDALSAEERQQLAAELNEMMRVRQEIGATPASEMISNHMIRFLDLATIYLETEPPSFSEAATAIEAFRAVLDGVGDRLGDQRPMLAEALGQMQMIFVQVKQANEGATPDA